MHLKKLIISGFKSFADKVTLNFDTGITGIVGPNGSGKSNVIDSVRWVMGEQNAKYLRGQVATDIIFAGSDKRKALGMAEVTLVIDNADASSFCPPEYRHEPEISLTRRLYVDGQREYFINKKPCRYKDILNFFAMTGLGGRSYSMIQQGQVDRILNAKPEDVREILEEAAGTLSFKARRAAAQKKLEATNDNLARITDIVAELGRQLDALKTQVDKAKKWRELSGELKTKELSLLAHNYHHFHTKLKEITTELDSDTDKEVEFMSQMAHLEARQEELQQMLNEADPEVEGLREQISNLREQIVRAEGTITSSIVAVERGEKRLVELNLEVEEASDNLKALEAQVDAAQGELAAAEEEAIGLRDLIESFQDEVDRVEESAQVFQNRIDELDDEIRNLDKLLDSNGLRCEAIERDRKRTLNDLRNVDQRIETLEADVAAIDEKLGRAKQVAAERQAGLDKEIFEKQDREQAVSTRYEEIKVMGGRRDELKEKYLGTRARYTSLQELEAGSSDIGATVEKLKTEEADAARVVKGTLTDYLAFNEQVSELSQTAVSAFEKWVERLVVGSLEDLNSLVRMVHRHGLGGFPVVVLSQWETVDEAKTSAWAEKFDAEPLARYIKVTKTLPELDRLLKRLYYLPSIQVDQDEINELPEGVIAFTAQGLVIAERDDFVIGNRGAKGALSRRSELERLAQGLKEVERELAHAQGELDHLEAMQNEDRVIIREIDEKLKAQNKDALGIMAELQSATQQHEHKTELIAEAQKQRTTLIEADRQFIHELEELGQTRISLGQERDALNSERESLEMDAQSVEDERQEVQRQHQQRKLELAKKEARSQTLKEGFAQTKGQLERLQMNLSRRYEERSRIEAEIEQSKVNERQCRDEIQLYIDQREELEDELAKRRESNAGIIEELKVVEGRLRSMRDEQNELQRFKSKRNVELERVRLVLDGVIDQAQEKYQLDLATYEFTVDPKFDTDATAKEVQRIRLKIEGMGNINMMAIEEYDRLSERYNFIEQQREEVIGSIRLLEEAIAEIEETSKDKFLSTFLVINQNFQELFPILFPGGEARLEMTDENDPLNAGVEIMVRLPGKKQQRMNLFSGGEKALTAISLIFALLKTKPTPFCFLDEVDAPLDEANVGRYNKVLEALSDRFQFIVITHNRRTMEVLDQLYGVTMQEGGVSKVLGVDMKKDIPAHLRKAFKEEQTPARAGASANA